MMFAGAGRGDVAIIPRRGPCQRQIDRPPDLFGNTARLRPRVAMARHALGRNRRLRRDHAGFVPGIGMARSEEHTSELQSLMRPSYAVFCLKKKQQSSMT